MSVVTGCEERGEGGSRGQAEGQEEEELGEVGWRRHGAVDGDGRWKKFRVDQ